MKLKRKTGQNGSLRENIWRSKSASKRFAKNHCQNNAHNQTQQKVTPNYPKNIELINVYSHFLLFKSFHERLLCLHVARRDDHVD